MKTQTENQTKTAIPPLLLGLVLACFGLPSLALATDLGSAVVGNNTADGSGVLVVRTSGVDNSGFGYQALYHDTSGSFNTAAGIRALYSNVTGGYNTANGAFALAKNNGQQNTATGSEALYNNTSGDSNVADGYQALWHNNTSSYNTGIGFRALYSSTGGYENTAVGADALTSNTTGHSNTAVGVDALNINSRGNLNTALGDGAGFNVTTASNVICIGAGVGGANVNESCFIGNIYGVTTVNDATPVVIDAYGQLGTASSSRRLKKEIQPMDKASEAILALKPVTFHYKSHKTNGPEFGLIAEDVAKVNPDLVVRDKNGDIYTVRYEAVNAMLLNEFLKEHHKVEEQNRELQKQAATIAKQQKQIEALASGLEKVSAQLEASRAAPQTVASNTQ